MVYQYNTQNIDMVPLAAEDWILSFEDSIEPELLEHHYFIAANCISGARFYSEKLEWEQTKDMMEIYCSMVDYFGGGVVVLYGNDYDDYVIIDVQAV